MNPSTLGGQTQCVFLTADEIHAKFPNMFSDLLGCIKDVRIKLDIDDTIRPCRQPQRPIAFHLREPVGKELMKQVEEGILEPVDQSCGPTPWVANLVVVFKDKNVIHKRKVAFDDPSSKKVRTTQVAEKKEIALRLTCDSREANKAIRRIRYPSKTVEDLIYLVNGAEIFSKLHITKAFQRRPAT